MSNSLNIGAVVLGTGALIPGWVWAEKETYSPEWEQVTNLSGDDLDRQIRREHWNFFFIGGPIQGTSWGSWSAISLRHAAIRVLSKSKLTKFNGFEVTGIYTRRFLGIRYVTVVGHSRHLQQGPVLQSSAERIRQASQCAAISTSARPLPVPALAR